MCNRRMSLCVLIIAAFPGTAAADGTVSVRNLCHSPVELWVWSKSVGKYTLPPVFLPSQATTKLAYRENEAYWLVARGPRSPDTPFGWIDIGEQMRAKPDSELQIREEADALSQPRTYYVWDCRRRSRIAITQQCEVRRLSLAWDLADSKPPRNGVVQGWNPVFITSTYKKKTPDFDTEQTYAGRATAVLGHPTKTNEILAGAFAAGVWRTEDGAGNWFCTTDSPPLTDKTLCVSTLAGVDKAGRWFVIAGLACQTETSARGFIISDNGGRTWTHVNPGIDNTIQKVVIDPTRPDVAYAAVGHVGEEVSGNPIHAGVWKTENGGKNWIQLKSAPNEIPNGVTFTDIVIDPDNPQTLYAAAEVNDSNSIYKRVNPMMEKWERLPGYTPTPNMNQKVGIRLAISKGNPKYVYAIEAVYPSGVIQFAGATPVLRRSSDDGATWPAIVEPFPKSMETNIRTTTIGVPPDNPNLVYIGGKKAGGVVKGEGGFIRYLADTGKFEDISRSGNGVFPHKDQRGIAFQSRGQALAATDGGVFVYVPDGPDKGWHNLTGNAAKSVNTMQFNDIAANPADPSVVIGGGVDNGINFMKNGVWKTQEHGDASVMYFDPFDRTIAYGTLTAEKAVGGNAILKGMKTFRRFIDKPTEWESIEASNGIPNNAPRHGPHKADPKNRNRLFCAIGSSLHVTNNQGDAWIGIGQKDFPWKDSGITSFTLSHHATPRFYVAANDGDIYVKDEKGKWNMATLDAPDSARPFQAMSALTNNEDIAYAVRARRGDGRVYRTGNAGALWIKVDGNLPAESVNDVAARGGGATAEQVFVATDEAIYVSNNQGMKWDRVPNLPNAIFTCLDIVGNRLYFGTNGRGAGYIPLPALAKLGAP